MTTPFTIYVNDLPKVVVGSQTKQYAEDTIVPSIT